METVEVEQLRKAVSVGRMITREKNIALCDEVLSLHKTQLTDSIKRDKDGNIIVAPMEPMDVDEQNLLIANAEETLRLREEVVVKAATELLMQRHLVSALKERRDRDQAKAESISARVEAKGATPPPSDVP